MASLGDLMVRVGANIDGYTAAMDQVASKASSTVDQVEGRFAAFGNVGRTLATLGAGLTAAITLPIAAIGTSAVQMFSDFESALNRVSAVGDITGTTLEKLKNFAIEMGAKTKFSALEAAQGMGELAAKGYDANQIMASLPGVLALAATESMSVADASKIASSSIAQFGLNVSATGHIADVLAQASADSASSVMTLGTGLEYVGPVAKSAGISFETTAGMLALLSNAGLEGEKAGTGLRGTIASLINPSKDAANTLNDLGIKTTDAGGNMRPLSSIMEDLRTKGATTSDMFNIFGREAASAALVLKNQGAAGIDAMTEKLVASEGAADRMAKTMNAGLKGAFEKMSGSIETAKIALGEVLAPLVLKAAEAMDWLADKMGDAVKAFQALPGPAQAVIFGIVGIAAAAGPLLTIVGLLGIGLPAVAAGFTLITGPIGLTVLAVSAALVALGALGTWVYSNWEPIKAAVLQAWDGLGDIWHWAWDPIAGFLTGIWQGIATTASSIWTPVANFLGSIWGTVAPYFEAVWNGISSFISGVWNGIASTAATVWASITGKIDGFLQWAAKIPGVNKLFNLTEAWENAEKLADKTKAATTETKAHTEAHKLAIPTIKANTSAVEKHGKAHKDAEPHVRKMSQAQADHLIKVQGLKKGFDEATDELLLLDAEIRSGKGPLEALTRTTDLLKVSVSDMYPELQTLNRVIGEMKTPASDAKAAADALGEAFKTLKITSKTELEAAAAGAKEAYDKIVASGKFSKGEITQAWDGMAQAAIDYVESIGGDTEALKIELGKMEGAHTEHKTNVNTIWTQIGGDIGAALDRAALGLSDAVRDLLQGEFSISKLGEVVKQLGLDIATAFLDVGARAITDFISIHLGKLLSAIPGVGKAIGGIFGGVGGAAGSAGSAAGSVGGAVSGAGGAASGAGGAASGAASGIAGALGAAGAIAGAVSSIIGNFQMRAMNQSLDLIEKSTRYSEAYNLLTVTLALEHWPYIRGIHDFLWNQGITAWAEMITEIQLSKDYLRDLIFKMADLLTISVATRDAVVELNGGGSGAPASGVGGESASVAVSISDSDGALKFGVSAIVGALDSIRKLLIDVLDLNGQPAASAGGGLPPGFTLDIAGQLSTANTTLSGISMMMQRSLALGGGGTAITIDLRGSTISDDAVAERLAQRITDRIRSVTR